MCFTTLSSTDRANKRAPNHKDNTSHALCHWNLTHCRLAAKLGKHEYVPPTMPWNKCNNESFHSFPSQRHFATEATQNWAFSALLIMHATNSCVFLFFGLRCTTLRRVIKSAIIRDPPNRDDCAFRLFSLPPRFWLFALCHPVALINHQRRTFPHTVAFPIFTFESVFPWTRPTFLLLHQLRVCFLRRSPQKSNGTSLDLERASADKAKPVSSTLSFIVNFFSPSNFFFKPFLAR